MQRLVQWIHGDWDVEPYIGLAVLIGIPTALAVLDWMIRT